ncbi:uncharacterized protein MONOS_15257 [Monocercomonoides exilis]|uniref:uncharacterized protein n=1 Tax=Monocercomonoides exilis TaxID=2049356 RepID=UPI0035598E90|nr:hypothetical protein MONOS_15257 [Monocercomonoides exilis]|eukprot:MONOS_15257.1-p1 / transcript=MONOS_15257.1 / gene=MONOS_15257 / organism=Monocercomonoides_exilis_PA203 / gene_product=unspecified product / transcript_product=unspecified product / location=Mono_scaffold01180:13052-13792(+) / protein_length=247 / sequence_SO=supercontig / SO=protein_coding / is_pseudo=false
MALLFSSGLSISWTCCLSSDEYDLSSVLSAMLLSSPKSSTLLWTPFRLSLMRSPGGSNSRGHISSPPCSLLVLSILHPIPALKRLLLALLVCSFSSDSLVCSLAEFSSNVLVLLTSLGWVSRSPSSLRGLLHASARIACASSTSSLVGVVTSQNSASRGVLLGPSSFVSSSSLHVLSTFAHPPGAALSSSLGASLPSSLNSNSIPKIPRSLRVLVSASPPTVSSPDFSGTGLSPVRSISMHPCLGA